MTENEKDRDRTVHDLLAAIADGEEIDWEAASVDTPLKPGALRSVRLLAALKRASSGAGKEIVDPTESADPVPAAFPLETGYDILDELGAGAHGRVYRAHDRALDRRVALKVVKETAFGDEVRARFVREARILASLEHPHIVRIHSIDEREGKLRLSLEHIEGRTLDCIVREDGVLDPDRAARIGVDLLDALAAIHDAGLIHGDVKPANVMQDESGRVVLLDFGVARDHVDEPVEVTPIGGTPVVMAPELFAGESPGPRADVFAAGVLLHWLVTAEWPFYGDTATQIHAKMQSADAPSLATILPGAPAAFAAVVDRALAVDPERRFPTAASMRDALARFAGRRIRRRRRLLAVALGVFVTALAALAWRGLEDGPIDLHASMLRVAAADDVRLETGDAVHGGDALVLEVESDRPLWVYVFNEDDAGSLICLFPLDDHLPLNPIPPGVRHRLPGLVPGGSQETWSLNDEGDAEFFLLLASDEPIREAEALRAVVGTPSAQTEPAAFLSPDDLRGVEQRLREQTTRVRSSVDFRASRLAGVADGLSRGDDLVVRSWALAKRPR